MTDHTADSPAEPAIAFTSLHLPEALARGIADAGFERCTPIQAQTLPKALAGFDVAGQAQTGTGKTAAFLIALYANLLRHPPAVEKPVSSPRALVLAPTRELAVQIHKDAEVLGQYTGLSLGLAYGGVDYDKQRKALEDGIDVLIGTPGRIIDYFKQRVFDLRHCQVMVLDEADRMFDLGFIKDIRFLLRRLPAPEHRQSMLFSATLSHRVLELAFEHMNEPEFIRIEPERVTAERVRQEIYYPAMEEKAPLLVHLLRSSGATRSMVFANTKRVVERLERVLVANGITAAAMSGDVPQRKRLRMLREFHEGTVAVLVATDVAARGLHVPDVSHVFNYDLPNDPEDYVHRIGRTARAGAAGEAISFGCEEYVVALPDIEGFIGARLPVASFDPNALPDLKPPGPPPRYDEAVDGPLPHATRQRAGGPGGRGGPPRSGGGPRRHGGGQGGGHGGGPRREERPRPPAPSAPAPAPAPAAPAAPAAASPPGAEGAAGGGDKSRRRRRRRRSGGGGSGGPPAAAT